MPLTRSGASGPRGAGVLFVTELFVFRAVLFPVVLVLVIVVYGVLLNHGTRQLFYHITYTRSATQPVDAPTSGRRFSSAPGALTVAHERTAASAPNVKGKADARFRSCCD